MDVESVIFSTERFSNSLYINIFINKEEHKNSFTGYILTFYTLEI